MAHYVYRVFDEDSRLIYVGSASDLASRLASHRRGSWWAYQAVKVRAVVYASRQEALAAETAAIKSESPRWNVKSRYAQNDTWTRADFIDYLTALMNQPGRHSPSRVRHMHQVGRMFRNRFESRIPLDLPPHPDGPAEDQWLDPFTDDGDRLVRLAAAISVA